MDYHNGGKIFSVGGFWFSEFSSFGYNQEKLDPLSLYFELPKFCVCKVSLSTYSPWNLYPLQACNAHGIYCVPLYDTLGIYSSIFMASAVAIHEWGHHVLFVIHLARHFYCACVDHMLLWEQALICLFAYVCTFLFL